MSSDDDPVLAMENVSVEYSDPALIEQTLPDRIVEYLDMGQEPLKALDDVSLEIGKEDVVVLIGESGSGKSTLARTAIGLQEPTSGTVRYRGHDIHDVAGGNQDEIFNEDIQRALQIVHQDAEAALNPYKTIRSILSDPLKLWYPEMGLNDRRKRIQEMLETTGISPAEEYMERYPHELSGGEQQRVSIIRAMLLEPDLIMADEVVGGLDVSLRVDIMDLLLDLQEMFGTSYLFISHNLTNARYMAEKADGRVAVMYLGNIVEVGPADQIFEDPKHPYTKVLKWASFPLDPQKARKTMAEDIPVMSTETPDPRFPPSGCRFHPKCPKAREACAEERPGMPSTNDGEHEAACFRDRPDHAYWDSEPLHEEEREIPTTN